MALFRIVQWYQLQCPYSSSSIDLVATTSVEQPPSTRGPASVCRDDKGLFVVIVVVRLLVLVMRI